MRGPGRRFVKGDKRAGRPKGRRNKLPGGSIRSIFRWLADERPELYQEAIVRALRAPQAKSVPMVALAAAYVDGRPVERVQMESTTRMLFLPGGSAPDLGGDGQ
jgi:hypothetical protein